MTGTVTPAALATILIAEDHPIFCAGLRALLETERAFVIVGEAQDGQEAVRLARELRPDVVLLDVAMPRLSGLDALPRLVRLEPAPLVILLTASITRRQTLDALQLGAHGVVLKEASTSMLVRSIHAVLAGQYWIERDCVRDLVRYLRTNAEPQPPRQRFGFSPRELQIVAAVVEGCSNKEIARRFAVSEDTVKHHLTNIFDKSGVSSRLELAMLAVDRQLISRD